jgi:hypothetical protein
MSFTIFWCVLWSSKLITKANRKQQAKSQLLCRKTKNYSSPLWMYEINKVTLCSLLPTSTSFIIERIALLNLKNNPVKYESLWQTNGKTKSRWTNYNTVNWATLSSHQTNALIENHDRFVLSFSWVDIYASSDALIMDRWRTRSC